VARRKKDVIAADPDSEEDEDDVEADASPHAQANQGVKKKKAYFYMLEFEVQFEFDQDTVYFAFSQPYTYSQITRDILALEMQVQPTDKTLVRQVTKVVDTPALSKQPTRSDAKEKQEK
jgi:hypothetical protein